MKGLNLRVCTATKDAVCWKWLLNGWILTGDVSSVQLGAELYAAAWPSQNEMAVNNLVSIFFSLILHSSHLIDIKAAP